jgi:polyketide cyclase/dehydrase/lipid transport protein
VGTIDQGFVPAPPERVYARLADVGRYGEWWPGAHVDTNGDGSRLRLPRLPEVGLSVVGDRSGTGLTLRLRGRGLAGSLEWYLEPFKDGTMVNAILDLDGASARRTMRVRAALRSGLVALRGLESRP